MDKQTYTHRVDAIVERMAKTMYTGKRLEAERFSPIILSCAQQAVAEMADMAKCLYHSRFVREGYSNDKAQEYTQKELKYQGLIPNNEPGGRQ